MMETETASLSMDFTSSDDIIGINTENPSISPKGVIEVANEMNTWKKNAAKQPVEESVLTNNRVTMNHYYIEQNVGWMSIDMSGDILSTSNDTSDFYTTPDKDTVTGDLSCDPVVSHSVASNPMQNGAKTANRSLCFSEGQAVKTDNRLPKHRSNPKNYNLNKVGTGTQLQIPFPCRKRKANPAIGKQINSEDYIENHVYIHNNYGTVIAGHNNKIYINDVKKVGESEEVDSSSLHSPKRSLRVTTDANYEELLTTFHELVNRLHPLRDNGNFKEFYCVAEEIAKDYSHEQHIQIIIMIEKSMALSYQREFDQSEKLAEKAVEMIPHPGVRMKNFLLVYSFSHLTGLYRRKNMLTKANNAVFIAKQNEEFIPFCIARVFVAYEHASNLTKQLSIISVEEKEPRQIMKEEAKKSLKECISLADRIVKENTSVYLQRRMFCLVKLALMNLNCRTRTSRSQPVEDASVEDAENCMRNMEEYEGDVSEAVSLQLYTAKSDLHFRKKEFHQAKQFAQQALEIAVTHDFKLEIKPTQERIYDINLLLTTGNRE